MMRINRRTSGISLLEVLVVLVILLIGIFSLVRLFPPGFFVNKQSEELTRASRLAKQELERQSNSAASLPDAIVSVIPKPSSAPPGYVFVVDYDATPDDLSRADTPIAGADPYYYSDVNKQRRVLGETVRIPIPSPTIAGRGSVHVLRNGPIYNIPWDGATESIFVSGAPLFRRLGEVTEPPSAFLGRPQSYAIDYDDAQVAFFPQPYERRFLATYSYYDAANLVQTVVDEVITVPADYDDWIALAGSAGRPLVPDSDQIGRNFRRIVPDSSGRFPWSTVDPYEYGLLSPNLGAFANVGVLVFNPLGHTFTEQTPAGPVPLTARVDYDILDWHIIREDRPMPAAPPYRVALSLRDIKRVGDPEEDQTPYLGVFRDPTIPAAQRADVVVYDLNTGVEVPAVNPDGSRNFHVNNREGSVTFADAFGQRNASGNFRFFYKARGDWALQIQKACHLFRRQTTGNLGFCQFYLGDGGADGSSPTRMYFTPMDAGKTVSIRELWYRDGSGAARKITNKAFRINARRGAFATLTVPGVGPRVLTWIDLKDEFPNAVAWDPTVTGQAAVGVQGVSFRSRVIWSNGSRIVETSAGNVITTRWRRVDVDTFLTRSAG